MIYIGIDPGKTGAIAIIENGKIINCENFPLLTVLKGKRATEVRDRGAFLEIVRSLPNNAYATIENPAPNGGNGAIANFEMGGSLDMIYTAFMAHGKQFERVAPQTWKGKFKLAGGDENKAQSIIKVQELFPDTWLSICPPHKTQKGKLNKPDHNRAEAVLLAEYGRRYIWNEGAIAA